MSTLKLIFSYKGRIRRKPFWLSIVLPVTLLAIALNFIPKAYTFGGVVTTVGYAVLIWITTAGFSKRLHDRDHSGWYQLIFFVPTVILYVLSLVFGSPPWIFALGFATFLVGIWIFIEAGFILGTLGHNRFAEDPALYDTSRSKWSPRSGKRSKRQSISVQVFEPPLTLGEDELDFGQNEAEDQMPLPLQTPSFASKGQDTKSQMLNDWLSGDEPEILRSTASTFDVPEPTPEPSSNLPSGQNQMPPNDLPQQEAPVVDTSELWPRKTGAKLKYIPEFDTDSDFGRSRAKSDPAFTSRQNSLPGAGGAATALTRTGNTPEKRVESEEQSSFDETDHFLGILQDRATTDRNHTLYLEQSAEMGNSWAKLEIAATWLIKTDISQDKAELAIGYLRELADSRQSVLGAETEASYFLGEIYRIGMRYSRPNEDLSFKYFIRAASLGHEAAQYSLASQIARSLHEDNGESLVRPLIDAALHDKESAAALMHLIEFDWSITYIESMGLVLRTLVDQGNGLAAKIFGRMLLERDDLEIGTRILNRADKLDTATIDKIVDVIRDGRAENETINALVDLLLKHAELGDPYAHYQVAVAFNNGLGLPQDNLMAFVHINLASARVHGRERDELIKLREDLRDSLNEDEILIAQEIVREHYRH